MNPHIDEKNFITDELQMDMNTEDDPINLFMKEDDEIGSFAPGSLAPSRHDTDDDALDDFTLFSKLDLSIDKSAVVSEEGSVERKCELAYSGKSSTIYRLEDPDNKTGGHTGFVAIKTLVEEFPSDEEVSRLDNEYNTLKHLSNCIAVRNPIDLTSNNGVKSLFLEWVHGIPLRKFVADIGHDPIRILNVARVVARAIADIHDAGVVHNNISLDNIIIDDQNNDLQASIKIIDFASASRLPESDNHASIAVRNDLLSLGVLFFEMFSGQSPFQQEDSHADFEMFDFDEKNDISAQSNDEKRRNPVDRTFISQSAIYSKLSATVPLCLVKLILILMEFQGTNQRYHTAKAVEQDLISFGDPAAFVSTSQYDKNFGQLHISPDKLYDQAQNISLLTKVCNRIVSEPYPEMVLISGRSGTGKSSMVHQVKKALSAKDVTFISGKFDQLKQVEPLAAILSAFSRYFTELSQKSEERISHTRKAILEAVGSDLAVLVQAIPSLVHITGKPTTTTIHCGGIEAENYFNIIFGNLIRAIAIPTHPLVLYLDDLHWADPSVLKLIKTLVTDTNSTSFLFVGCFRDDEINDEHPLMCLLNSIEKTVPITIIETANISKDSINEMVSETLHMSASSTKSLADLVYRKTGGNGLIVSQFLQTLWYEGSLQFLLESNTWTWDVKAIESKCIPDDAVGLLVEKILHLPHVARCTLQCLSCLGSRCHESTFRIISDQEVATHGTENGPSTAVNMMIEEGLLNKDGSEYKFAHDQIQLAAYSLIPSDKRGFVHLQIGSKILEQNAPEPELGGVLFIVADQLNRGSSFIEDEGKKVELADLNLKAGEKAISLGTFSSAVAYLQAGIEMLREDSWVSQYYLSLRLHSLYAESLYSIGDFTKVGEETGQIIMKAKSTVDKLCAYITLIKAVAAQRKAQEAIKIGLQVLEDLGEPISTSNTTKEELMAPLFQAKSQFEGMTDDHFMELKQMDNADKIAAMKILDELSIHTIFANTTDLLIAIVTKMMQLSLINGICEETSIAFSHYAFMMVDFDSKGAHRIGNLALSIIERLKIEKNLARVYAAVYGGVHHHFERMESSLNHHMRAYQSGLRAGDISFALFNGYFFCMLSLLCGKELTSLKKECDLIVEQATKYQQVARKTILLAILQTVMHLIGHSDGHFDVQTVVSNSDAMTTSIYYFFGSWVAYIYGEYDIAADMAEKKREAEKNLKRKFLAFSTLYFYEGLIFWAIARKTRQEMWIHRAQECMSNVNNQVQIAPEHFQHRLMILEAEAAYAMGDVEKAKETYERGVNAVTEYGYMNEQAIACERAGDFFCSQHDERATQYYGRAQILYKQWGAQGKADHLCQNIPI